MGIVVFTGAGAGKADGLPLQTELFQEFFAHASGGPSREQLTRDVQEFFRVVFGVDAANSPVLPTFEEALGVLELAVSREETIVGFGTEAVSKDLQYYKRQLILALVATIGKDPKGPRSHHAVLVASLRAVALLDNVTFITTNYDTLLDDAIEAESVGPSRGTGSPVDYGIESLSSREGAGKFGEKHRTPCYKIHGSLNWLHCSGCDILDITYGSLGVTRLVDEPRAARCPSCGTLRTPVVVPPSYYKNVSNVQLGIVWSKAYRALCTADQLVFCGYSFPDADMHVKYLVKRAQLNRGAAAQALQVTLVNNHKGKAIESAKAEHIRFSRFLGVDVKDSSASFEEFASDPASVLGRRGPAKGTGFEASPGQGRKP